VQKQKASKKTYRLRNWGEYTKALQKRGSISVWISDGALEQWSECPRSGQPGRPYAYSALCIETMLTVKAVYDLGYRQMQGFVESLFLLMQITVKVPCYTQVNRRARDLGVVLPAGAPRQSSEPLHVVIDSTGVKVFGEGEWKVRQHGVSKRRTWRKLHIAADESSGEILSAVFSSNGQDDAGVVEDLLEGIAEEIAQVSADTGYDKRKAYAAIAKREARAVIPPQKNAKIWQHGNSKSPPLDRDENLRAIRRQGRDQWKQESGYHRRSIIENVMYRYKTIGGDRLRSREFQRQATEVYLNCAILNRMAALGMPESYAVP
jgi:hypothetical protein